MKSQHAAENVSSAKNEAAAAHDKAAVKLRENANAKVAEAVKKNSSINPVATKPAATKVIKVVIPAHIPELHPAPVAASLAHKMNETNATSMASTVHEAKKEATPAKPVEVVKAAPAKAVPSVKEAEMETLSEEEKWILSMPEEVLNKEHGPMKFSNVATKAENI